MNFVKLGLVIFIKPSDCRINRIFFIFGKGREDFRQVILYFTNQIDWNYIFDDDIAKALIKFLQGFIRIKSSGAVYQLPIF